jgi:hypothetical protein
MPENSNRHILAIVIQALQPSYVIGADRGWPRSHSPIFLREKRLALARVPRQVRTTLSLFPQPINHLQEGHLLI